MEHLEVPTEAVDLSSTGEPAAFTCHTCAPALGPSCYQPEPVEAAAGCLDTVAVGIANMFSVASPAGALDCSDLSEIGEEVAFTCARCALTVCSCGDLARSKMREGIPLRPDEFVTAIIGFVQAWLRLAS